MGDICFRSSCRPSACGSTGASSGERTGCRTPLYQSVTDELRCGFRILSSRKLHHEIQSEDKRRDRGNAGIRWPASAPAGAYSAGSTPLIQGSFACPVGNNRNGGVYSRSVRRSARRTHRPHGNPQISYVAWRHEAYPHHCP